MARVTDIADYLLSSPSRVLSLNLQMMAALGHRVFGRDRIDLFIASYDHGLLHRWWTQDDGWHPRWERRGGAWASRAAVVTPGDGRIDVFGLGLDGDLLWTACQGNCDNAERWHIERLGHPDGDRLVSHPTAVFDGGSNRVYVRGESAALWTIAINTALPINSGWQPVTEDRLPEWPARWLPAFAPAATSWSAGRVDLFAVRGGVSRLEHTWRDLDGAARSWRPPENLRGRVPSSAEGLTSSPEAVVWPKTEAHPLGVIHVSACGQPNPLIGPSFVFTSWLGRHWQAARTVWAADAVSSAALASWGHGRLDLFYVGVVPGGNYYYGPWHAVQMWTRNLRDWHTDNTSLGAYPVEYFPGG